MSDGTSQTLCKSERLNSMTLIGRLFNEPGNRATTVFPVRAIYKIVEREADTPAVRVLMSVPKRKLHHAVDRNRVKRQLREAYRKQKALLADEMESHEDKQLLVAFVWLEEAVRSSATVENSVSRLMNRIKESL
ncbi:MAG: ribonuclease P protein component [Prevotella sp.]|nr:ribonuclease P protein component [Prevotella sp.]